MERYFSTGQSPQRAVAPTEEEEEEEDTVIHKNESDRLKMQRDLVVVILYGSICNQHKIVKM